MIVSISFVASHDSTTQDVLTPSVLITKAVK